MPNPRLYAGQTITAGRWNSLIPNLVTQENDQVLTNTTDPTPTEIQFTPEPNAVYLYWCWISYSATTAAGIFWEWDAPGALMCSFTQATSHPGASGVNTGQSVTYRRPGNTTNRNAGGTDTTSPPANFHSAYDQGTFSTDGTTSAIRLMVGQATAHANQTILRGGNQTRMTYQRIA